MECTASVSLAFFSPVSQQDNLIPVLSVPYSDKHNLIDEILGFILRVKEKEKPGVGRERERERMNLESWELQWD